MIAGCLHRDKRHNEIESSTERTVRVQEGVSHSYRGVSKGFGHRTSEMDFEG